MPRQPLQATSQESGVQVQNNDRNMLNGVAMFVVEHTGIGLLYLDENLQILLYNKIGEEWISKKDLFCVKSNTLYIEDPSYQSSFEQAIAKASRRISGSSEDHSTLSLKSKDGGLIVIDVIPFQGDAATDFSNTEAPGALTLIREEKPSLDARLDSFRTDYVLTETEVEVIRLLLKGFSPTEIADLRCRSLKTVRTQIRAVLAKTRCHTVGELMAVFNRH